MQGVHSIISCNIWNTILIRCVDQNFDPDIQSNDWYQIIYQLLWYDMSYQSFICNIRITNLVWYLNQIIDLKNRSMYWVSKLHQSNATMFIPFFWYKNCIKELIHQKNQAIDFHITQQSPWLLAIHSFSRMYWSFSSFSFDYKKAGKDFLLFCNQYPCTHSCVFMNSFWNEL